MERTIFEATPLQAFSGSLWGAALMLGLALGAVGMMVSYSRGHVDGPRGRVSLSRAQAKRGMFVGLLVLCGMLLIPVIGLLRLRDDYSRGQQTLVFAPQEIKARVQNDPRGPDSIHYEVWPAPNSTLYFEVSAAAYRQMAAGECYKITYYGEAHRGVAVSQITQIRALPAARCGP
jgi:hypothetical protein